MTDSETPALKDQGEVREPPKRPAKETARLGDAIYERDIRRQVEDDHVGEIVAIDVENGNWAMGASVIEATDRLWERYPDANDVWSVRVGYAALRSFGAGSLRRRE